MGRAVAGHSHGDPRNRRGRSGALNAHPHGELPPILSIPGPAFNPPDPQLRERRSLPSSRPLGDVDRPPQPRRSTRQIRTTAPGVGWDGRQDDGYLDVASDEMSQTFTVSSELPLTIRFPSGLKLTLWRESRCPVCKRRSKSAPGVGPKVRHPGSGISRLSAGVKSLLQSVV